MKTNFVLIIICLAFNVNAGELNKKERNGYKLLKTESSNPFVESSSINSVDYTTALGLRFGFEGGITLKHFISSDRAIEGILSSAYAHRGIRLTGLYEIYAGAFDVDGLSWFYGFGAHIGYGRYGRDRWNHYHYRYDGPVIGIDGIIGMEYQIQEIPFSVSLDIKPAIDIIGFRSGHFGDIALSIRYIID
ncbi:MAG: hypothetical protein H0X62_05395 [Bacteroidetes bacterium]|nr:hypothetical protein [Bacteroidota bacterium]